MFSFWRHKIYFNVLLNLLELSIWENSNMLEILPGYPTHDSCSTASFLQITKSCWHVCAPSYVLLLNEEFTTLCHWSVDIMFSKHFNLNSENFMIRKMVLYSHIFKLLYFLGEITKLLFFHQQLNTFLCSFQSMVPVDKDNWTY